MISITDLKKILKKVNIVPGNQVSAISAQIIEEMEALEKTEVQKAVNEEGIDAAEINRKLDLIKETLLVVLPKKEKVDGEKK